jgi:5'(3')-deoxyribonucleotidase
MIKDSKHIFNLEQGTTSIPEVQPIAFKATEENKEESTPSRLPIDTSKLDNEEMALIIKSFRQILKQRKGKDYKPNSKRVCYRCGKSSHFIAKCPYTSDSDRDDDKKGKKKKMEKKRYYKKKGGEAHMGREWDSDGSSTDSFDEDADNITVNKGLLFPNVGHKCLKAKYGKKKIHSRDTPKYTTSDDEGSSSDDNDDLTSLLANLTNDQKKKINELIETINEKDDILESQEDLLVKENKKFVKLKNAYALEVEKCENLFKELDVCNDSISCLRTKNASLTAKIEELNVCNVSTSTVEHVTICTLCRDVNIDAMNDHLAIIKKQNDHLAKLNAKIAEHELENENFKFARSMLYNGRCPIIKDDIGFRQGSQSNIKLNAPKNRLSNFVKGKAPMV